MGSFSVTALLINLSFCFAESVVINIIVVLTDSRATVPALSKQTGKQASQKATRTVAILSERIRVELGRGYLVYR